MQDKARKSAGPQQLSAAFTLAVQLCRLQRHDAGLAAIRALAGDVQDWPLFLQVVERHRIWGVVADGLRAAQPDLPSLIYDSLQRRARQIACQNLYMAQEGARLQHLLDEAGIPAILYKGVALAQQAYGTIALKHGHDIDLLVRPGDVAQAFRLLENCGYRAEDGFSNKSFLIDTYVSCQQEIHFFRGETMVELHWHLVHYLPRLDDMLWQQRCVVDLDCGIPLCTFAKPEHLIYLSVHGGFHNWFRLKWLTDFYLLLRQLSAAEGAAFLLLARQAGVECPAFVAIRLCMQLFGAACPAWVEEKNISHWRVRLMSWLCLRAMHDVHAIRSGTLLRIAMRTLNVLYFSGIRSQCHYISRSFYCTLDIQLLPLPAHMRFVYPLLRLPLWFYRRLVRSEK